MSRNQHFDEGAGYHVVHEGPHPFGGEWSSVRTSDDKVIGAMRYDRSGFAEEGHTHVAYISVDDEHRGRGVAQQLYRSVHEHTGQPFLHRRDDMSPEAKKAVAKSAAQTPGAHKVVVWRNQGWDRTIQAYPARRRP